MGIQALKDAVFRQVDPSARPGFISFTNKVVIGLILARSPRPSSKRSR
jgi:hypothetical protein